LYLLSDLEIERDKKKKRKNRKDTKSNISSILRVIDEKVYEVTFEEVTRSMFKIIKLKRKRYR